MDNQANVVGARPGDAERPVHRVDRPPGRRDEGARSRQPPLLLLRRTPRGVQWSDALQLSGERILRVGLAYIAHVAPKPIASIVSQSIGQNVAGTRWPDNA